MHFLFNQVTIIGLGLMGSSIARALKEQPLARRIVGCSQSKETLEKAKALGIIDSGVMNPADSVKRSELVILCTPLSSYEDIAAKISTHLKPDAILTDIGSVKKTAIDTVSAHLRRGQVFIPSHPIAGSEKSGVEAGDGALFQGKKIIITPASKHHSQIGCTKLTTMWQTMGAHIEIMDAVKHDRIYAAISHSIQLLSYAYASAIAASCSVSDAVKNEEFKGFLRLAGSNHTMWQDIFALNCAPIALSIENFTSQFSALLALIEQEDYTTLLKELEKGAVARKKHTDTQQFEAPKRSYSTANAVFAHHVALPKMIACAAFNAFSEHDDYAGSGFWGFTQTLTDISALTVARLESHREHILQAARHFFDIMQMMQDRLGNPSDTDFITQLEQSEILHQKLLLPA